MAVMGMVCTVPSLPVIDTVRPADVPSCPQNVPVTVWARTVLPLAGVKANAVAAAAMKEAGLR